ncbi:MAG TPA: tRNA (5-methylaminomethyl-2-thiouridine)(34)-methyltransferase MnmD, partial [Parvularculaceae bacterium]|nr:tRNA (5-methylaminomethyl-2-thiouridine)(34)-methyltransferase MnmD [Parvularculaceae bacterium]
MTEAGDNRKGLSNAALDWAAGAPRSRDFDDIYFSDDGAAEVEHVFLAGNDLAARFSSADVFWIGELGFGTGLNFLKTWALWERASKPGARLVYLSIEKFPMRAEDLARAHAAWPELGDHAARLRKGLPPPVAGLHHIDIAPGVTLILGLGDAMNILCSLEARINAWFLDGFAPSKNPDMWSEALFREIAWLSAPGATVATFTVAGDVRRALAV